VEQSSVAAWRRFLNEPGEQLRVGVPPQHLRLWWSMIGQTVREQSRWFFDVAAGQVWVAPRRGAMDAQRLAALRQPALAVRGYAALVQPPLDSRLDRWGYRPDGLDVMRRIRAAWDPAQILNPGEFVV
jgi:FAD/FMN-containing dehydrogenase